MFIAHDIRVTQDAFWLNHTPGQINGWIVSWGVELITILSIAFVAYNPGNSPLSSGQQLYEEMQKYELHPRLCIDPMSKSGWRIQELFVVPKPQPSADVVVQILFDTRPDAIQIGSPRFHDPLIGAAFLQLPPAYHMVEDFDIMLAKAHQVGVQPGNRDVSGILRMFDSLAALSMAKEYRAARAAMNKE